MEWMRPTVSNFRLQIEPALVPRHIHVGPRLTRAPGHRRTANAFASGCRVSVLGRDSLADQVAARTRHHRPVRTMPPPSARDFWKTQHRIHRQYYIEIRNFFNMYMYIIVKEMPSRNKWKIGRASKIGDIVLHLSSFIIYQIDRGQLIAIEFRIREIDGSNAIVLYRLSWFYYLSCNRDCAILLFIDRKPSVSSLVYDWPHRSVAFSTRNLQVFIFDAYGIGLFKRICTFIAKQQIIKLISHRDNDTIVGRLLLCIEWRDWKIDLDCDRAKPMNNIRNNICIILAGMTIRMSLI